MNIEQAVESYRRLRDKKAELKKSYEEQVKPVDDAMAVVEQALLAFLRDNRMDSVKSKAGTAYQSTLTNYTIDDASVFRDWAEKNNRNDFYANRLSKDVVEEYISEHRSLPPGVKVSSFTKVNVRK